MFLENAQFGGYKLKSMIGKGGVAEVWLADQLALDREVAVKVISSELVNGEDADFVDRFKREAHSVARLDHPGILPVFDYGESGGYLYLVMPYARGGNLRSRVRRNPPTREEIAAIYENITGGIGHAHSHGLIHRDLKPANILLNEDGRAFIADFGIAKTMDNNTNMTQAGIILGSPSYMAPEQFLGQADKRSDIYSMGLILFFMLTGRKLYNGRMPFEIGKRHLEEPIPLPDPQVPADYEPFLYKVLAKNPDERFQSAPEMLQAFKELNRGLRSAPLGSYNAGSSSSPNRVTPAPPKPAPAPNDPSARWMEEKRGGSPAQPAPAGEAQRMQEKRGNAQPAGQEQQWMQEKKGGGGVAPAANQEAQWMREKGGTPAKNSPDEAIFNSFSEIKAPPPPPPNQNQAKAPGATPGEARWMQEKRGEVQPSPEGTMWREFDPSLNSFGELKNQVDQTQPAPDQWMQEKRGNAIPAPNPPNQWMQEKGGNPPRNAPQQYHNPAPAPGQAPGQAQWMQEKQGVATPPNQARPDAAYERYSREKNLPAQPNQAIGRPPGAAPTEQERWMQEKRGGAAGVAPAQTQQTPGQAQWMQEKAGVPGQGQGQAVQQAQWRREKEGVAAPPPGQGNFGPQGFNPNQPGGSTQPQVTKTRRKQPIWLFVIIGVLVVGVLAAVAVLVINPFGKGTPTPTAQASITTTATGTTAATTTGPATTTSTAQTTPAVTSSTTTGPTTTTPAAGTTAVTTAPATTGGTTANGNDQGTPQPSVGAGTGAVALSGHAGPINMVSWSPNGQLFLTASDDKTIKAWDAATNKVVKTLDDKAKPNSDRVISAVFSKDGQFVVATLADNTVNVYSYNNGNVVAQVKGDLAVPAAISGDQTLVAYAGSRTIRTFDLKKNAAGPEFPYFDPTVKDLAPVVLAFSPDNSTLAVGLSNGRIILYATASGKPVMELEPLPDTKSGIKQLAWFGNGAGQLAVGREASVETLAIDLSKKVATNALTPQSLDAPASSLNVSADGKRLAVSTQKGDLQLWSLENNSILTRSSIGTNPVIGLHWSQDDQKITIATGGGSPALNTVAAQQTARSTTITLTPQNGTKVTGTALLTEIPGGSVRVTLNVEGLDPGQHNVHIHAGTCANQGDIKFDLETLRPTADGKATSTTVIKTDFTSLITGSFYINVHNDPGTPTYIASCGEIHV